MTVLNVFLVLNALLFVTFVSTSAWRSRMQAHGAPDHDPRVSKLRQISISAFVAYLVIGLSYVVIVKDIQTLAIVVAGLALIFGLGWLLSKRAGTFNAQKTLATHMLHYRVGVAVLVFMCFTTSVSLLQMLVTT